MTTQFTFKVTISRVAYFKDKEFTVTATSPEEAGQIAEQQAANELWSEQSADYEIEGCQQLST